MNHDLPDEIKSDSQDAVPAGDADSNRKAADFDYRKQIADVYLKRRAKGFDLTVGDESFVDQLIADGIPSSVAVEGINQAFDKFKPKHKRDEIRSLRFCEGIIYSINAKSKTETPKNQGLNDVPDSQSDAEVCSPSEEEIRRQLAEMRKSRG